MFSLQSSVRNTPTGITLNFLPMPMAITTTSHASTYYHVFLSFRGEDTRLGFTGNLYNALTDKGIHTFIDDEDLQRGQEITPTLVKSIQESRIAIVVLSKHYASSSFCLDELATIIDCNLNDDIFLVDFTRFAHLGFLDLSGNNFTFLPECLKDFQSLFGLDVNDCEHLREIRGVPPNIEYFDARNCKSLTSLSISMLINEESHAARIKSFCWPGAWIPEWLEHKSRGASTCFWFRNKLPHYIICLLIAPLYFKYRWGYPTPKVFINGKVLKPRWHNLYEKAKRLEMDHTYLLELHRCYDLYKVPLENGWNHVEITYEGVLETSDIKAMGIHVFKRGDIRYSDPNRKRKLEDDIVIGIGICILCFIFYIFFLIFMASSKDHAKGPRHGS